MIYIQNNVFLRHLDEENLRDTLESDKLCSNDVEQVVQLVRKGRYSEACKAHFTARVGMVVQSYDEEKPIDLKVNVQSSLCNTYLLSNYILTQTPVSEPNENDTVFTNPAQYFTSFVDEMQSDSE